MVAARTRTNGDVVAAPVAVVSAMRAASIRPSIPVPCCDSSRQHRGSDSGESDGTHYQNDYPWSSMPHIRSTFCRLTNKYCALVDADLRGDFAILECAIWGAETVTTADEVPHPPLPSDA
ncbi:hypothetical protein JCM17092_25710 [Haloplanus litoreus]